MFSSGWINLYKITVSDWRNDSKGPMQVVSGAIRKEKNHFQAPNSALIESEMSKFLQWLETDNEISVRLLNINVYKRVSIDNGGGLEWPYGMCFCPNFLREYKSELNLVLEK